MSKCVNCGHELLTGDIHWEMGLCNNCYNELYKDHKTYISLDKMWLKLAQDFRDENEKLQDKIADLEAKLAEKDKKIETILKENEELVIKHNVYNWGDKIQKDKVYFLTGEALELLINIQNQKSIEQLEKVEVCLKEGIEEVKSLLDPIDYEDYHELLSVGRGYRNSIEIIDNQIEELKKEMK